MSEKKLKDYLLKLKNSIAAEDYNRFHDAFSKSFMLDLRSSSLLFSSKLSE